MKNNKHGLIGSTKSDETIEKMSKVRKGKKYRIYKPRAKTRGVLKEF